MLARTLLVLALLLVLSQFSQANSLCSQQASCSSCGSIQGCVWCASNSTCQDYSSTSCIGNAWYTYPQCDSCPSKLTINQGWGVTNSVPQPTASITYNNGVFNFVVNASYLTEDYTYVVDFEGWNKDTRSINSPNNCENRLASTFSGKSWANYWNSAPFASLPDSLNSVNNPTYGPSAWTVSAPSCSAVSYSRSFSFSDLASCKGNAGNSLVSITQLNTSNVIQYAGNLVVTVVKAVDGNNSAAGYTTLQYTYPFSFNVVMYVNTVVTGTQGGTVFVASVSTMGLVNNNLKIVISSNLGSISGMSNYVTSPVILSSPVPCSIVEGPQVLTQNTPCTVFNTLGQCQQYYTLTSNNASVSYSGQYVVQWTVVECNVSTSSCVNTGRYVTGTLSIDNSVLGGTQIDTNLSATMTFYTKNFAQQTNGPFYAGDTIVVKEQLNVATSDVNQFKLTVNNAWICYSSVAGQVPKYDPTNGLFGCQQPYGGYVVQSNIVQLVANGVPTAASTVQQNFKTQIMAPLSNSNLNYYTTTGLSFSAQPISTQGANYYIQIEATVGTLSRKAQPMVRRVMLNSIISQLSEAAYISVGQNPQSTPAPHSDASMFYTSITLLLVLFMMWL